jgi:hypothetical protein
VGIHFDSLVPRLRIFRDVWNEDIKHLEEALESSEALLKMVQDYSSAKTRGEIVDPPLSQAD